MRGWRERARRLAPLVPGLLAAAIFAAPVSAQSPTLAAPGLGTLTMATSARSDSAQSSFLRGVLLLHLFEYSRAAKAFREAEATEPDFAMAYWGEAMTHTHPVWDQQDVAAGRAALARLAPTPDARAAKAPTARERAYLAAVEILYGDGAKAHRDTLYSEAMEHLARAYPNDDQAHLFYALSLLGLSQGVRVVPTYLRAAAIAESALAREPHNPGAAHYLIHSVDDPDHASRGLPAARALLAEATDAGHGLHMSSHIFMAMGMWDEVVAANETAIRVVSEQAAAAGRPAVVCGHYPSWLEYGYLQQGRIRKARALLHACAERARAARSGPGAADPDNSIVGSYAMMRTRYLVDTGDPGGEVSSWGVDPGPNLFAALTDAFAGGLQAARRGDVAELHRARAGYDSLAAEVEARASARGAPDPGSTEFGKRLRVLGLELAGLERLAAADSSAAITELERATAVEDSMAFAFGPPFVDQPSHELLGQTLLAMGRATRARDEFRETLRHAPRRTSSLLGLARAALAGGDTTTAARAYGELVTIWHDADPGLTGLAEARSFAAAHPVPSGSGGAAPRPRPGATPAGEQGR
jgi:tetratricopeptide (TPR) repeat protein